MLLTSGQLGEVARGFARIPHDELLDAALWFVESAASLPSPQREVAACLAMTLEAVADGVDVYVAVGQLADALAEHERETSGILPLGGNLWAFNHKKGKTNGS